jgi:Tol biopolymer transport system component
MGRWAFSVSRTGVLVYATEQPLPTEYVWVDPAGRHLRSVAVGAECDGLALSHDGRHLVSSRYDPSSRTADLWSVDTSSGSAVRLTRDPDWADSALWTPDDSRVVFSSARNTTRGDLFIRSASSSGADEVLLTSSVGKAPQDWTADGRLLFSQAPSGDLWETPLDGNRRPRRVLEVHATPVSDGHEVQARLSPDRRLIAWSSNVTGQWQVFVDRYPQSGRPLQVSVSGGDQPRWNPNGREVFYRAERAVMAATITGHPLRLTSVPVPVITAGEKELIDFAPTRAGFILNVAAERTPASTLNVVLNWDRP